LVVANSDVVSSSRLVDAPAGEIFGFLSDLENHWELADRFIEVLSLERRNDGPAYGGQVRMRGPLGIRRTVTTRVVETAPVTLMRGTAELAGGGRAGVSWSLGAEEGGTRVRLTAELERSSTLDRVLLAAGGRAWLERRFDAILATLAARLEGGRKE
jgi:hypothetical protein